MIGLTIILFGGIWTLVLWVRKAVGWFKPYLMGRTSRSMEDSGAENDLNCRDQEVSEEKNVSMWPRNCSCNILMKNVDAFCPFIKSLPELK